MNKYQESNDYEMKIIQHIARLSSHGYWGKKLNIVAWQQRSPKIDIRSWTADHSKIGKGVALTKEEAIALRDALINLNLEEVGTID